MTAADILDRIRSLRVLVVGDICLDRWCYYDPKLAEPSRETGLPRVAVVRTDLTPGAAGTVASNLVALGVRTTSVAGVIGEDGFGVELIRALNAGGISAELSVRAVEVPTFTYTKLINVDTGVEDLPRVDFINALPLARSLEERILTQIEHWIHDFDVVLVSDQAETEIGGVVTPAVRQQLSDFSRMNPGKLVWVDSRMRPELFQHVVLKPNEREAEEACRRLGAPRDYQRLLEHGHYRLMIVTRGAAGAEVVEPGREEFIPGRPVEAVDICGAGDSFSAGAATALAAGAPPAVAARFGNLVASITVTKPGTGRATPEEVLAAEESWR